MKTEMNYSGFVDRYLNGVMSPDERNWFDKELDGNTMLQEELVLHKKINSALADRESLELETQLNDIYEEAYQPLRKLTRIPGAAAKRVTVLGVAAAAVLVVGLVLTNLISRTESVNELYADYYEPAEINMSFRAAEDMVDSDLRSAMVYYEKEEYEKAIELFEKILRADESRIGLNLYSGISHMEIEEYEQANRNFQKIIDHKANAFIESAEWYLGLCYLMTDQQNEAKEVFYKIASEDGYYRKEAKRILKMIK